MTKLYEYVIYYQNYFETTFSSLKKSLKKSVEKGGDKSVFEKTEFVKMLQFLKNVIML